MSYLLSTKIGKTKQGGRTTDQTRKMSNSQHFKHETFKHENIQAGRMVAEDLELTVETLRCKEDREAGGLVKKVCVVIFLVENRINSEKVCPSFWLQISYHCHMILH